MPTPEQSYDLFACILLSIAILSKSIAAAHSCTKPLQLLYVKRSLSPVRIVLRATLFLQLHRTRVFLCIYLDLGSIN